MRSKKEGSDDMIPVWWIIPAIFAGAVLGIMIVALVSADRDK